MTPKIRPFYVGLALLMTTLVFVGFWPTYFSVLASGEGYGRHWVFHLHAAVFLGWMALLLTQTVLAARRRTKTHMAVGTWGFLHGVAVFAMGVVVSLVIVRQAFVSGAVTTWPQAVWRISAPLTDITQFAILLALGWRHRRKVEFHRRYMVLATVAILPAATARMGYLLGPWSFEMLFVALVAILAARDVRLDGRLHPANMIGIVILLPRLLLNVSYKFL